MADKIPLTCFLLRQGRIADFEKKLLKTNSAITIPLAEPLDGLFLPMTFGGAEPDWVDAVRSILNGTISMNLSSQSPGGLLLIRRQGRTFVVAFGHAWQKLDDEFLELDFGRKVALNSIPKDHVLELRAEQIMANWHLASERAPRASKLEAFGVEFDRDLVSAVEGVPALHKALGRTVRGAVSLRLHLAIKDLPAVLDDCVTLFASKAYQTHWPEIDNIRLVDDSALITTLDQVLDGDLVSGIAAKRISLFTPAQKRDEPVRVASYVYGNKGKAPGHSPYLTYKGWLNYLTGKQLTPSVAEAKVSPVHLMDDAKAEIKSCKVYDCIGYEVDHNNGVFVLSSGAWFEVMPTFIAGIKATISAITPPPFSFPAWKEGEREEDYNRRGQIETGYLNCDARKIFYGGGSAQFELCDLLNRKDQTLCFAKNGSKSSGMSHLTEQVRRTAQLLFGTDPVFRDKASTLLTTYHKGADVTWLKKRPRPGDWKLCMLSLGRQPHKLPFFARCGIVKTYKDLREGGHTVYLTGA